MGQREVGAMQDEYIKRMIKHLPLLRTAVELTQAQLGKKIGVSRQTIVAIENGKRPLPWSVYLAIVLVFKQYDDTIMLLESYKLFDPDYIVKGI